MKQCRGRLTVLQLDLSTVAQFCLQQCCKQVRLTLCSALYNIRPGEACMLLS